VPDPPDRHRRRRHPRHRYRAQAHESAHANSDDPPADIPDHPLIPRGQAVLITRQAELLELIDHARSLGSFAYDSEFIGELSYLPRLCLVQVCTTRRIALIDPLAQIDLRPFWELVADPAVEKIVHAGEQDLEPVVRVLHRPAANIFDTQIAAGFASLAYPVALSRLVRELLGAHLGKGFTFTHWDQRPLTAVQMRYAADDVRYLPALRAELGRRLDAIGHARWASAECELRCDVRLFAFDPDRAMLKVRGVGSLGPNQLGAFRELFIWRDQAARAHDLPPRTLIKDEVLLDLARSNVKSVQDLAKIRGLPRPVEQADGPAIVAAIARGQAAPIRGTRQQETPEDAASHRFRADALWALVQAICLGRGIDPALVTSRQEVALAYLNRVDGHFAPDCPLMQGWRREAVGDALDRLLAGQGSVHLQWQGDALRAQIFV